MVYQILKMHPMLKTHLNLQILSKIQPKPKMQQRIPIIILKLQIMLKPLHKPHLSLLPNHNPYMAFKEPLRLQEPQQNLLQLRSSNNKLRRRRNLRKLIKRLPKPMRSRIRSSSFSNNLKLTRTFRFKIIRIF